MALQFTKATKEQAKLRLAIYGPSGAGKTMTALRIAQGMGGKIALIDTERKSSDKYADRFEFSNLDLAPATVDLYIEAIKAARGFDILIIDSLTHAWAELLQEVDDLARTKYRGNKWSAWSEGTPKHKALVEAILSFDGHVIATMRSKTEWVTQTNEKGKTEPVRLGLAPEQGKGIEYEFDMLIEMNTEHVAHVIKDRTGRYQDMYIELPDEKLGSALMAWLADGKSPEPTAQGRPYSPETLKTAFEQKLRGKPNTPPTQGKRGATVGAIEALFTFGNADKEAAEQHRHMTTQYLIGKQHSSDGMMGGVKVPGWTDAECDVLLKWAQTTDETGSYVPHPDAIKEAAMIVEAFNAQQGQQKLGV